MSVPQIQNDIRLLAPVMAARTGEALNRCHRKGFDAIVYETRRSAELQAYYYAQGRTRPGIIVTNVSNPLYGWHYYGLAIDVISKKHQWSYPPGWLEGVSQIFEDCGLDWGGRWRRPDLPHYQFKGLKSSPSDRARELLREGGLEAVWRAVGAI